MASEVALNATSGSHSALNVVWISAKVYRRAALYVKRTFNAYPEKTECSFSRKTGVTMNPQ